MQDLLVGGQVALSMVLLIGSLLVARSLSRTLDINFGFDPNHGASVAVNLVMEGYSPDRIKTFRRDLLERARALPGVESAALAGGLPLALDGNRSRVTFEGQPTVPESQLPVAGVYFAGEGYFRTMRIPLVRGRDFADDAFHQVTNRFSEYLRGLPFTVEFHDTIAPHQRSGKHQTIIVERAATL